MATTIQAGIVVENAGTIAVTDASGTANVVLTLGRTFRSTDEIFAWLKAEIEAVLTSTWTFSITLGVVSIESTVYPFTWDWDTATDLRDFLGYAAGTAGQAVPWIAPAPLHGYLYLATDANVWPADYSGAYEAQTAASPYADGTSEASTVPGGIRRKATVTVDLDNEDGIFSEVADYDAWVEDIQDGRPFTVWVDGSTEVSGMLAPEVTTIEIAPRFANLINWWRSSFVMSDAEVSGERW